MDRELVARELLKVAKELMAAPIQSGDVLMEFGFSTDPAASMSAKTAMKEREDAKKALIRSADKILEFSTAMYGDSLELAVRINPKKVQQIVKTAATKI